MILENNIGKYELSENYEESTEELMKNGQK